MEKTRETWADVAKGACIVLVVLWHVVAKHYLRVDWQPHTAAPGAWGTLGEALLPLRMPVFFTVSGVFATSVVRRSWPDVLRTRVARFGYLYVLWVLLDTVLLRAAPHFPTERADGPLGLLAELTISPTNLWYLLALAVYVTIARATRRVPVPLLLGAAFVLSVVASSAAAAHLLAGNRVDVAQNLVFFLGGLHLRPVVERLAARASRARLLVTGAVFAAAVGVVTATDALAVPGVWPACAVLAVTFGVTASALVGHTRVGPGIASVGRRTLPVYVLHLPPLALLDLLPIGSTRSVVLQAIEPALMTALVVAICLVLHRVLLSVGASWLFDRPVKKVRPAGQPVGT